MDIKDVAKEVYSYTWDDEGEFRVVQPLLPQLIINDIWNIVIKEDDSFTSLNYFRKLEVCYAMYKHILQCIVYEEYTYHIGEMGDSILVLNNYYNNNRVAFIRAFRIVYDEINMYMYCLNDLENTNAWELFNDRLQTRLVNYDKKN